MKKTIVKSIAVAVIFFLSSNSLKSQAFSPNITTGPTYRGGAVGIGLTQAFRMLDVANITPDDGIRFTGQSGSGSSCRFSLRNTNDNIEWGIWAYGLGSYNGSGNFGIGTLGASTVPPFFINGSNGNIGVGTNAPTERLGVNTSIVNDGIAVTQSGSGASALHMYNNTSGGNHWALFSTGANNVQGSGNFSIIQYGASDRLFINGSNGNTGIGTINPISKLHVESSGSAGVTINNSIGYALAVSDVTGGKFAVWPAGDVTIGSTNYAPQAKLNINGSGSSNAIDIYNTVSSQTSFRVKSNGQTSIGNPLLNSSPHFNTYLLSVKGKIVSQEVIVTQNLWADFVFDEDYKIIPLSELEYFYKENHHLPDVPSTKEVYENGNDLGKTDALLLQKIEELTLYLVEQGKSLEKLNKEVLELKKSKQN